MALSNFFLNLVKGKPFNYFLHENSIKTTTILITGAAEGIGYEIVKQLLDAKCVLHPTHLILVDQKKELFSEKTVSLSEINHKNKSTFEWVYYNLDNQSSID